MPASGQRSFVPFGQEYVYLTLYVRPVWPMKLRKNGAVLSPGCLIPQSRAMSYASLQDNMRMNCFLILT